MPIRPATLNDLSALLTLEERSFTGNKLSRRSMRHALTNPQALMLVDEEKGHIRGAVLMFQHARSKRARLYSLAVDPDFRRQGIAEALLREAECRCIKPSLKLELRTDNKGALALYERQGYRINRSIPNFYEDGCAA